MEEGITTVEIITTAVDIDADTAAVRSKYKALYLARHVHIAIVLPSCSAIIITACRSHQFKSHYSYFD